MGGEEKLAFQLRKRKSRRIPPILVTDMDFENDISLVSDGIKEAEDMLRRVDIDQQKSIGLNMNTEKTKYMSYNNNQQFDIKTIHRTDLKRVEDFKYLGAKIAAKKMSKSENIYYNNENGFKYSLDK